MKVKDLLKVVITGMPVTIELGGEMIISVGSLYFGGHCMIPESLMDLEVELLTLSENNGITIYAK